MMIMIMTDMSSLTCLKKFPSGTILFTSKSKLASSCPTSNLLLITLIYINNFIWHQSNLVPCKQCFVKTSCKRLLISLFLLSWYGSCFNSLLCAKSRPILSIKKGMDQASAFEIGIIVDLYRLDSANPKMSTYRQQPYDSPIAKTRNSRRGMLYLILNGEYMPWI